MFGRDVALSFNSERGVVAFHHINQLNIVDIQKTFFEIDPNGIHKEGGWRAADGSCGFFAKGDRL